MTARVKLTIAYHGAHFAGWQRQSNAITVQQRVEEALEAVVMSPVAVHAAGRTDAGVHARGQCAHVDVPVAIPPDRLLLAVNHRLPTTIRVRRSIAVPADFHARFDATAKRYVYRGTWRLTSLPWCDPLVAEISPVHHPDALREAALVLLGQHDFGSFTVPEVGRRDTVRTLTRASVRVSRRQLTAEFVGDGFLRYQVRRMMGALLEIGCGQRTVGELRSLMEQPAPGTPITTAPARGLCLEHVYYRRPLESLQAAHQQST